MTRDLHKFEDTGLEIRERDNADTENLLVDGEVAHASDLAAAINYRPDAEGIVIPGQRMRPSAPPKNHAPHEAPASKQRISIQDGDAETGRTVEIKSAELSGYTPAYTLAVLEDAFYLAIDMPGVEKSKIKIGLNDKLLTISGERSNILETMRAEIREKRGLKGKKDPILETKQNISKPAKFKHPFELRRNVDETAIVATMADGVLKIMLPFRQKTDDVEVTIL